VAAALAAALGVANTARAHELTCEKTVNGQKLVSVDSFPTTVTFQLTVTNVLSTDTSVALTASDPLLEGLGFSFTPAPPISLGVGESVSDSFDVTLHSFDECVQLASTTAGETLSTDVIDNVFRITWDLGEAECHARVICVPPSPPPCENDCVEGNGATRTMGFFKTHEQALTQCLASGPIDLGFVTIVTLQDALGLLWGSPVRFADGTARDTLDKDRFLLGRQTLTAICNQRLFGTMTTLIADAVAALGGTDCTLISSLESMVDAFNNSGDSVAFPSGFTPGPATPRDAQSKAVDPTAPSGQSCQ
jgi:hypothetical protein